MGRQNLRAVLAADPELGAGNVLTRLLEHGADPAGPGMIFDVPVDGIAAWEPLTLGKLHERVAARAASLHQYGIKPRDPVAVYVTSSADCFLNFMALTWLGAIPALMNPNIPAEIAAEYIRRLRAVAVLTDSARRERLGDHDVQTPHLPAAAELGTGDPAKAPEPYRFVPDDPIAITHSSGTTRMPTAVVHSHSSLFAATRKIRLSGPRAQGTERVLSALPAPHTAGILTVNQALCNRAELLFLSTQDDADVILDAIERWQPAGVFGFAVTWAELARHDLTKRDLSSVAIWFNTGDCAHEAHIKRLIAVGSHLTVTKEGVVRVPGSTFYDGIGSTEMGHSAFHIGHRMDTDRWGRCVGKPHVFVDVRILDMATGAELPPYTVGHLGFKSPTLSLAYWNDSVQTYRTRLFGYYLTGDLMYRDEEGYYFHMDRQVDSVPLLSDGQRNNKVLYTAMSEERILARCPDVRDCTVVAVQKEGRVLADVLLLLAADALPEADRTAAVRESLFASTDGRVPAGDAAGIVDPDVAATLRTVKVVTDDDLITGPTGKVRKFLMRQRHLASLGVSA